MNQPIERPSNLAIARALCALPLVTNEIDSLNFENVQTKKVFRYTFVLERAVYGSMLMDYLNAKYEGIKIIEKADTKLVIETNVDMNTLETFFKTIDALKIKKISDYNYQVTK